jgi:NTP pyrophosphatase (non-canonical NTP hydrolase)
MPELEELTKKILDFRDKRDWRQFHNPKDLALSLVLEASEVLEHFQWKNGSELEKYINSNKNLIAEELADVLYWVLLMSKDLDINILQALDDKLKINEEKYPIEKSKGKADKYTELI